MLMVRDMLDDGRTQAGGTALRPHTSCRTPLSHSPHFAAIIVCRLSRAHIASARWGSGPRDVTHAESGGLQTAWRRGV